MRSFGTGALFVLILMLANVVAAGVFAVLGPIALELADEEARVLAMVIIGLLSVLCAVLFLRGAVVQFAEGYGVRRRLFREIADPHKGLQSAAGQRGG